MGWGVAAVATVFAIKGSIQFDINQWMRDRRERKKEILRSLCPHVYMDCRNGKYVIRSAYISPIGTAAYQCQMCGHSTHDENAIDVEVKYWADNPKCLMQRIEKAKKLYRKLGH